MPYQVCGTTCLSIKLDVNVKSRRTQRECFITLTDIIFIPTNSKQEKIRNQPSLECVWRKSHSVPHYILNYYFLGGCTWEKKYWSNNKTESLLSQGSEIASELYSVTPKKSLRTAAIVSLLPPGTLNNSVCIHLLSLTSWTDCKLLRAKAIFYFLL